MDSNPTGEKEARPRKALVAEDDQDCRLGLQILLRGLGYEVVPTRDGRAALTAYEQGGGADLLITDLMMPRMDGAELIRRVHAIDADLPVIAISGASDPHALLGGASSVTVLGKPFAHEEFVAAVQAAVAN